MVATSAMTAGAKMMPSMAHSSQPSPFRKGCLQHVDCNLTWACTVGTLGEHAVTVWYGFDLRLHCDMQLSSCTHLRLILKKSLGRGVNLRSVRPTTATLVIVSSSCKRWMPH